MYRLPTNGTGPRVLRLQTIISLEVSFLWTFSVILKQSLNDKITFRKLALPSSGKGFGGGGEKTLLINLVPTTGRPVQENNNLHTPTDHMPDIRPSQFDVTPDTKVII